MTGNNHPLVSVLMPYYNGRKFVREALQSLLNQTYKNIEIIVVNDASSDKEDSEYIEKLANVLGFKLIEHSTNKGISHTLADAFEASSGDFIAELSQDDLYKSQKIEKQMNELASKKLDAVYTAGDVLHQSSGKVKSRNTAKTKEIIESGAAVERLKLQNLQCLSIQGLLAKRSVFERDIIRIWREYLLDDWPVHIRLFERYKVGFIEDPLWRSRSHAQNTSRHIWKWLGPQIEVVARMAPEHLKAEGIGNRLASMARRVHKQNGSREYIIRFAFAGLMLTESPDQCKKATRVLSRLPSKHKKAISSSKRKLLKTATGPAQEKSTPERMEGADWKDLGIDIANVVSTHEGKQRLHEIGKRFSSLAFNLLSGNQSSMDYVIKFALAALMLVDDSQEESQIVDLLRSVPAESRNRVISQKRRILKVRSRPTFRSFYLK